MPPKNKGAASAAKPANSQQEAIGQSQTVHERATQLYELTQPPYEKEREELGFHALATVEKTAYANWLCTSADTLGSLSKKAQKELWKQVNDLGRPLRRNQLWKPTPEQWGRDRHDRAVGDLSLTEFERRAGKQDKLSCLTSQSNSFRVRRALAAKGLVDARTGEKVVLTAEDVEAERTRRQEMAFLKNQLYGEKMGSYAADPDWDDVVPIPQMEPENALAAIAYPEDYAESMSYLRAVMAAGEYSPRCLKLTEHIISVNPAHYTVWLYRFSIVQHLETPVLDEVAWLNDVAFENHKNYQIWHHRQLLLDHYYPMIEGSPGEMARFVKTEREFIMEMLSEDAKNYHVWSYRQSLVRKLGAWDEDELASIGGMIADDVRNNSAWSHRFFLVFSNPSYTTLDSPATEHDPKVPADIMDREIEFAKEKIALAPQNQSPWNYLYGVLVKGGRKLGDVREFAEQYVQSLGEDAEDVRSSHALDLLSSIYAESGDVAKADLCLGRLGERWDRIRGGYWEWKRKSLQAAK